MSLLDVRTAFDRGYRVTQSGDVTSPAGGTRKLRSHAKRRGQPPYLSFSLAVGERTATIYVHKLAALQLFGDAAFAPDVVVRHLDGDSVNNSLANLALGSQTENAFDRLPESRKAHALKAAAARRLLSDDQVRALVERRRSGARAVVVAREFGVRESTVSEIMSGKLYSELTGIPFVARRKGAA